MNSLIVFLVGVGVGAMAVFLLRQKSREGKSLDEMKNVLGDLNKKRAEEVEENKRKILEMFGQSGKVSNNDVEKLLGVSDAVATRYLQRLEDDGKIVQIGKEGHAVRYKLK